MSAEDNRAIDIMHDVATFFGKLAVSDYTLAGWIAMCNKSSTYQCTSLQPAIY